MAGTYESSNTNVNDAGIEGEQPPPGETMIGNKIGYKDEKYYTQEEYTYDCTFMSLANIDKALGHDRGPDYFRSISKVKNTTKPFNQDIVGYLNKAGFKFRVLYRRGQSSGINFSELRSLLGRGNPVFVDRKNEAFDDPMGHTIVLSGYEKRNDRNNINSYSYHFYDPQLFRRSYSGEDFRNFTRTLILIYGYKPKAIFQHLVNQLRKK